MTATSFSGVPSPVEPAFPSSDAQGDIALLWRRAGFGAVAGDLNSTPTFESAVTAFLDGLSGTDIGGDKVAMPELPALTVASRDEGQAEREARRRVEDRALRSLQDWWLNRMIASSTPLREKLALFWHGHFATAYSKVRSSELMYLQNQLFRTSGAGNFGGLALRVAQDGAMMRWLDTVSNDKADPNENFSREFMELFTLGVGNYTQADVHNAARAFTGWRYRVGRGFQVDPAQHDDGTKTVLGHSGDLGGEDVVEIVTSQAASARFVTAAIWSYFAAPIPPSDPVVDELVAAYGPGMDVTATLRAVFSHPRFRTGGVAGGLVKTPVEWVVGAARALSLDALGNRLGSPPTHSIRVASADHPAGDRPALRLASLAASMGQTLFEPPNVGGWPPNAYWLDTATALARIRASTAMARRADLSWLKDLPASARVEALGNHLAVGIWGPTTAGALAHAAADPPTLVALALASPEYVLA